MLTAFGAADHYGTIVYGDEMTRHKPDPEPYLTGLDRLGVVAAEALAFEDSIPGVQAAKAAGILTIGITNTRTEPELEAAGANITIQDFTGSRLRQLLSEVGLSPLEFLLNRDSRGASS